MMTKAFLQPTGLFSPAMVRVAKALERHHPGEIVITRDRKEADLLLFHVIAHDAIQAGLQAREEGRKYAVLQCCLLTAAGAPADWIEFWRHSALTWSYYDLRDYARGIISWYEAGNHGPAFPFYHSALGVDSVFTTPPAQYRRRMVVTTGHVNGHLAEAIEEVWVAAKRAGVEVLHVGSRCVPGHPDVICLEGISDTDLRDVYQSAMWTASLRGIEGFELPAAEGLCCGARPILYNQPSMRTWYGSHAHLVTEDPATLVDELESIFRLPPAVVTEEERRAAVQLYDWRPIAQGFWSNLLTAGRTEPAIIPEGATR